MATERAGDGAGYLLPLAVPLGEDSAVARGHLERVNSRLTGLGVRVLLRRATVDGRSFVPCYLFRLPAGRRDDQQARLLAESFFLALAQRLDCRFPIGRLDNPCLPLEIAGEHEALELRELARGFPRAGIAEGTPEPAVPREEGRESVGLEAYEFAWELVPVISGDRSLRRGLRRLMDSRELCGASRRELAGLLEQGQGADRKLLEKCAGPALEAAREGLALLLGEEPGRGKAFFSQLEAREVGEAALQAIEVRLDWRQLLRALNPEEAGPALEGESLTERLVELYFCQAGGRELALALLRRKRLWAGLGRLLREG